MAKQKKSKVEIINSVKGSDQKSKPTPEQMRIAQILEKKVVDSSVKIKLKQIMDVTQRSADEVYVALHDSDFDPNRAVDLLIEGGSLTDWCTSEKKKKKLQELKEKKSDETPEINDQNEETSKTRSSSFRKGNDDGSKPGRGRGYNNQERAHKLATGESSSNRGRGFRGRGRRTTKSMPGTMVFERTLTHETTEVGFQPALIVRNQWEKPLIRGGEDEWDTEEFTGSLSQTQIFTSSVKQDLGEVLTPCEEVKTTPPLSNDSVTLSQSSPLPQANLTPCRTHDVGFSPINASMLNLDSGQPCTSASTLGSFSNQPAETKSEFLYRLSNYSSKSDHRIPVNEEKKPPSKIPTSAVEMPPEMKPSLSFLDIQFGAIDLGPSASEVSCSESHSNVSSQNSSSTTFLPPSNIPSSGSIPHLMANNCISSSASTNNLAPANGINGSTGTNSMIISSNSTSSAGGINHLVATSNIPTAKRVSLATPNNIAPNTGSIGHIMAPTSISSGTNHLLGPSNISSCPSNVSSCHTSNDRFMPYSFMTAPSSAPPHQFESRSHETSTTLPPPHMTPSPHIPPFKQSPTGVPKGAIVANLPPGSLVGNQYLVGQGSVPYFPHHPIYYYEEMPPVINNQQRLAHHMSSGYDVSYQPTNPSTRDGVHYNV